MALERTKAGFCALFFLAGCAQAPAGERRLTDREWEAIVSEGVRETFQNSTCKKVSIAGAPGYYSCGPKKIEPYYDHLFK